VAFAGAQRQAVRVASGGPEWVGPGLL